MSSEHDDNWLRILMIMEKKMSEGNGLTDDAGNRYLGVDDVVFPSLNGNEVEDGEYAVRKEDEPIMVLVFFTAAMMVVLFIVSILYPHLDYADNGSELYDNGIPIDKSRVMLSTYDTNGNRKSTIGLGNGYTVGKSSDEYAQYLHDHMFSFDSYIADSHEVPSTSRMSYKWLVRLSFDGDFQNGETCTGAAISKDIVLADAQCIVSSDLRQKNFEYVKYASNDWADHVQYVYDSNDSYQERLSKTKNELEWSKNNSETHAVESVSFLNDGKGYLISDVAIVKLSSGFEDGFIQPAKYEWNQNDGDGKSVDAVSLAPDGPPSAYTDKTSMTPIALNMYRSSINGNYGYYQLFYVKDGKLVGMDNDDELSAMFGEPILKAIEAIQKS